VRHLFLFTQSHAPLLPLPPTTTTIVVPHALTHTGQGLRSACSFPLGCSPHVARRRSARATLRSIATLLVVPTTRVRPQVTRRQSRPLRSTKCARQGFALGSALRRVARSIAGRDRSRVLTSSTATLPRSSRPLRAISDASAFATTTTHLSSPPPTPCVAQALPPWLARKPHADHTHIQLRGPRRNL
jgi:hypothetical protein